jgi:hypothetical protein
MENCDFILMYVQETGVLNYNICVIHFRVLENEFLCCCTAESNLVLLHVFKIVFFCMCLKLYLCYGIAVARCSFEVRYLLRKCVTCRVLSFVLERILCSVDRSSRYNAFK